VRCAVHNNREAVGVCLGCGAGVCTACRVSVGGLTYCSACLEAGRYRPPQAAQPSAGSEPATLAGMLVPGVRLQLTVGVVGLLMLGIALHLAWIGNLSWGYVETFAPSPWSSSPINPISIVSSLLTGISITLVGIAFSAFARVTGSRLCQGTAIMSFVSAYWLPAASVLELSGQVWRFAFSDLPPYWEGWLPASLYYPYIAIVMTGLLLEGVTLLLWPSAFIATSNITRQRALAIASAVFFFIAAHTILLSLPFNVITMWNPAPIFYPSYSSLYYSLYGVLLLASLLEPACILGAILIYRFRGSK